MKNKEAYVGKMVELLAAGDRPALKNGVLVSCADIGSCENCDFCGNGCTDYKSANTVFSRWANEEFVTPEINWDLVPIDTPIYVWDGDDERPCKLRRHFAGIGNDGRICAWQDGRTSFTNPEQIPLNHWKHAELAEFHSEWMKKKEG